MKNDTNLNLERIESHLITISKFNRIQPQWVLVNEKNESPLFEDWEDRYPTSLILKMEVF